MTEILYFAWVRERIGKDSERLALPADVHTVAELLDWLSSRGEPYSSALAERGRLRVAVDQVFAAPDTPVRTAAEIAIFPPVTGG